jgi:hypothetical protein
MSVGIVNLKKIVDIGLSLGNFTANLVEGDKVSWAKVLVNVPSLVFEVIGSASVLKELPQLKVEFEDLDEAEKLELVNYVQAKLDIDNAKAKSITIIALELVFKALEIVDVVKA